MAKIKEVQVLGFTGRGATDREARADAQRQIAELQHDSWTPEIVSFRGIHILVSRDLGGWNHRFISESEPLELRIGCSLVVGTRWEVIRRAQAHVADLTFRVNEDPIDFFPEHFTSLTDKDREELISTREFRRRMSRLLDADFDHNQVHQLAGWLSEAQVLGKTDEEIQEAAAKHGFYPQVAA